MSYYSDNDWRYYSEDYLEHASLRDKWNDLMSKTTIDDNIKGAYEGAKNAVGRKVEAFKRSDTAHRIHSNVTSATRPIRNAGRTIGAAASNAGSAVSGAASNAKAAVGGAVGRVRNMFGLTNAFIDGKNSEEYNKLYYKKFRDRILAAQKAYREAKKNLRRKVHQTDNKVDDAILRGYERGKANLIKGGVSAANAVRGGINKARTNVTNATSQMRGALDNAIDNVRGAAGTAANRLERSARGVVPGMAMTEYRADQRRREDARNNYQQSRMEAGGNQRRKSNRG